MRKTFKEKHFWTTYFLRVLFVQTIHKKCRRLNMDHLTESYWFKKTYTYVHIFYQKFLLNITDCVY